MSSFGFVCGHKPDTNFSEMPTCFDNVLATIEPTEDTVYGSQYRCAVTLKDGTHLPCVVLQSHQKLVDLAKRRIKEEIDGRGKIRADDPYGLIVSTFVTKGNRINDYDVASAEPSRFAPPFSLLRQIHGETTMGWTGWVFEMTDGKLFSYGSWFRMDFLHLPEGYGFNDVTKVHNHSFVSEDGNLMVLHQGGMLPKQYDSIHIYRERVHFTCCIKDI